MDAGTQVFRHSEAAGRGIPRSGATQYVVVTPAEPTGGFFGRLRLPLNDVQELKCAAGCGGNVDARGSPPPPSSSRSGDPPWRAGQSVRGRGDQKSPSFRGHASGRGIPHGGAKSPLSLPRQNHRGDCVVAKYARLRFRLTAKASLTPLLLLFGRDPLRWVRVRDEGSGA